RLWKLVLLNQFHDILPGSSIALVYEDAKKDHAEVQTSGEKLREAALSKLCARGKNVTPLNTIGFERREVAIAPDGDAVFVEAPSYGIGRIVEAPDKVQLSQPDKKT